MHAPSPLGVVSQPQFGTLDRFRNRCLANTTVALRKLCCRLIR